MGNNNPLRQLNKKIQRDKQKQVDKQYADQLLMDKQQSSQDEGDEPEEEVEELSSQKSDNDSGYQRNINAQQQYDSCANNKRTRGRKPATLLLRILSSVIRNQSNEQQPKKRYNTKQQDYHWVELSSQQGLINIKQQLDSLRGNESSTTRWKLLEQQLKATLTVVENNNRISNQNNNKSNKNPIFYTTTSPTTHHKQLILAQRLTINQSQQLSSHLPQYKQQSTNTQYQQQLSHYTRVNKLLYEWRRVVARASFRYTMNELPLVHVYEYLQGDQRQSDNIILSVFRQRDNNNNNNSNKHQSQVTIYQQHIPHRLPNLRTLTHLQGLYVLQQSLLGFMLLYQVVGEFHIQQDMIGFTHDGVVKVWLSPLFETNLCQLVEGNGGGGLGSKQYGIISNGMKGYMGRSQHKDLAQKRMVTIIYFMVQKYSLFNKQFITFTRAFTNTTFNQALNLLHSYKYQLVVKTNNMMDNNKHQRVKFITRLRFQEWHNNSNGSEGDNDVIIGDYAFYRNNLFMKEAWLNGVNRTIVGDEPLRVSFNSFEMLQPQTAMDYNGKPSLINVNANESQPHTFVSTQNYLYPQKPSAHTMTSLSSHITLTNNAVNNRTRPPIFNHGYSRSMSNNYSQSVSQLSYQPSYIINNNKSSITSKTYLQSREQKNNNNRDEKQRSSKSNATFVTIKSQQR